MKRAIDLVVAGVVLIASGPLMIVIAVLVLLQTGRPVFYRGPRVGRHGRPFAILKFRTMTVAGPDDADPAGHVGANDARITSLGATLRALKLDEWPQWWNVLRGDMSLVGPRPMTAAEVAEWPSAARAALALQPGLVDWATLVFHNEGRLLAAAEDPVAYYREHIRPRKLALVLHYLHHPAWRQDPRILWEAICLLTVSRLLRRDYHPAIPAHRPLSAYVQP